MDEMAKLMHIREFCNSITGNATWHVYELACDIRDFIDGDTESLPPI
jgi:hypothetical protein